MEGQRGSVAVARRGVTRGSRTQRRRCYMYVHGRQGAGNGSSWQQQWVTELNPQHPPEPSVRKGETGMVISGKACP